MKRVIAALIIICCTFSLSACSFDPVSFITGGKKIHEKKDKDNKDKDKNKEDKVKDNNVKKQKKNK